MYNSIVLVKQVPDTTNILKSNEDDKEEFNYVKCKLTHKEFEEVIYEYEKRNEKYLTDSLLEYLKRKDPGAELFHLQEISY